MMDFLSQAPPCDLDAERGTIGSILIRPELLAHIVRRVEARDFYDARNAAIFAAALRLYDERSALDVLTLRDALRRADDLGKFEGADGAMHYVTEVAAEVPTAAHGERYAEIVHDLALIRDAGRVHYQAALESLDARDAGDYLSTWQTRVDKVREREYRDEPTNAEMIDSVIAGLEQESSSRLLTGFSDLDRALGGGTQPGEQIVLAGITGSGKTTLGENITANCARQGHGAAFFSCEMRTEELFKRLLFSEASVDPIRAARDGGFTDSERERMNHAAAIIKTWPIRIEYRARLTPMAVRARAQQLRGEWGGNLRLVVCDYLGLMASDRREERREREVAAISRSLKLLSGELDCTVITICQLNRQVDRRGDSTPRLSDLRDSGAIEQDADRCIFLHVDPRDAGHSLVELILAKNRHGPCTRLKLAHFPAMTRFADAR